MITKTFLLVNLVMDFENMHIEEDQKVLNVSFSYTKLRYDCLTEEQVVSHVFDYVIEVS